MDYQENEDETMEDEDEDDEAWMYESVESGRKALLQYRIDMENLFKDWDLGPFRPKEPLCYGYLYFLLKVCWYIHTDKSDVTADLKILEDLKTILKRDLVEGQRQLSEAEFAFIRPCKILGMMLLKLDSRIPDNEFRKWIQEKRRHLGSQGDLQGDFQEYLEFVDYRTGYLPKEFADELKSLNVEIIDGNQDDIRNQLTVYLEEEEAAYKISRGKEDCVFRVPPMLRTTEKAMCKLRDKYSEVEIKEERLGGAQPAIQAVDGVKLAKPGEKGLKRKKNDLKEELEQASEPYKSYPG